MLINVSSRLGEVKEYYFSKKLKEIAAMRAAGIEVLNLGIGSPDLPPAPSVINALQTESLQAGSSMYQSYVGIPELRQAYADFYQKWYGVDLNSTNEVLPLIGSKEGIMHISMTYLELGDEVLIPNPGYPTYSSVANLTGASIRKYDLLAENNWLPDLKRLAKQDLSKVKIMWVNYPNMPTGGKADLAFFERLVAFAKKQEILVINDNPYSFILNDKPLSIMQVEGAREVALELNSLSKSHNMAGWRMGVLVGAADYLQNILRFKSNMDSGMYRAAQVAAVEALRLDKAWYDNLNTIYNLRQQKVHLLFDLLGCTYDSKAGGMFVWGRIPARHKNGYALSDLILEKTGVFITPGGIFGTNGDNYIRASLCNSTEVFDQAIEKVKKMMTEEAKV